MRCSTGLALIAFCVVHLISSVDAVGAQAARSSAQTANDPRQTKDRELSAAKRKAEQTQRRAPDSAAAANAWQDYGNLLVSHGEDVKAVPIMRRALAIRLKVLGENHVDTAYSLNQLGWALETAQNDAAAEPHFRRALAIRERVLGADHSRTLFSVLRLGINLYEQSKYAEAEPLLRRAAETCLRTMGFGHADTATSLRWLGDVLDKLGRTRDAVSIYEQALQSHQQAFGDEHVSTALALNNLGWLQMQEKQLDSAIANLKRAAAVRERLLGKHNHTALTLQNLATAYFVAGQFELGAQAADRALAIREEILAPDDADLAGSFVQRAIFHQIKGEFSSAETLIEKGLSVFEKKVGSKDDRLSFGLEALLYVNEFQARYTRALELAVRGLRLREEAFGSADDTALRFLEATARNQEYLGLYADAERSYRKILDIREKKYGPDHGDTVSALMGLADAYKRQGRLAEAEQLYRKSVDVRRSAYGPAHYLVAVPLSRLGRTLRQQERHAEAEVELRLALEINEKHHGEHFFTAISLEDLADVYDRQGKTREAEDLYRRSLSIKEKLLGPNHPSVATALGWMSSILWKVGKAEESEAARLRQVTINLAALGPQHDDTASSYSGLGWVQSGRARWNEALSSYDVASDILIKRNLARLPASAPAAESEIGRSRWTFHNHVRAAYWAPTGGIALAAKTFELAQWAHLSDTSMALSQMALRAVPGDRASSNVVREHQDLLAEWRVADSQRSNLLSKPIDRDSIPAVAAAKQRLELIERRLVEVSERLRTLLPRYAELSIPQAVPVADVQRLLTADEVVVQFSLTPADCFVWVISTTDVRWVRLNVQYQALAEMVAALRQQLVGGRFNLNLAYGLYQSIFEPIGKDLAGKHLLIVPTGILTTLPLHLLVSQKPEIGDEPISERYRKAAWMIKSHPMTMLPSVSALKALRQQARASPASNAYLGIGNPLIEGPEGKDRRAEQLRRCSDVAPRTVLANNESAPGAGDISSFFRGGAANVEHVRRLEPLPETVGELCAVAKSFGRDDEAILIGGNATEQAIKRMSRDSVLADVRVLHFATHGLVAGELTGLSEPALVLSPPQQDQNAEVSAENDALLTASEISQLRLNADWVVLSACNTASGSAAGAEALSGLAKAFFYAGARALLVSHWMVDTEAAVQIMVKTFAFMADDPRIGRAEALRRALLSIIESGSEHQVNPRYWAPFVVVGEGGGL